MCQVNADGWSWGTWQNVPSMMKTTKAFQLVLMQQYIFRNILLKRHIVRLIMHKEAALLALGTSCSEAGLICLGWAVKQATQAYRNKYCPGVSCLQAGARRLDCDMFWSSISKFMMMS